MCKINIDMKEPAEIFVNGVNAGRMEILKQLEDILNSEDFPEYVDMRVSELVKKYQNEGII